jgi:glycosyltransferase involved in cell wall biosynthesis
MKVVFCIPTLRKPSQATLDSMAASVPLLNDAGYDHMMVSEIGCPYISNARATMLRKALDAKADVIVFIDHDVSWRPFDLISLIQTDGDFVAGTYRFKDDEERYMGHLLSGEDGRPIVRDDGALRSFDVPAGFLKITNRMVNRFVEKYPELCYGERHTPHIDLFNHGAHDHVWHGEDYMLCKRWRMLGGEIWTVPNLNIDHHSADKVYKGNLHEFLLKQPGGSNNGR